MQVSETSSAYRIFSPSGYTYVCMNKRVNISMYVCVCDYFYVVICNVQSHWVCVCMYSMYVCMYLVNISTYVCMYVCAVCMCDVQTWRSGPRM